MKELLELKASDVERIKNRPAISVFSENMSLGSILENAYITPKFFLRNQNETCVGIDSIYQSFKNKNIIFIGEGGIGKTSAFLRLYTGTHDNSTSPIETEFYYCFAPDLLGSDEALNDYQKKMRSIIEKGTELNGILLLDGLEEAYLSSSKEANDCLKKLSNSNITFWVACRTSFYKRLDHDVLLRFSEKIEVIQWEKEDYDEFFSLCLSKNEKKDIIMDRINEVKSHVKSLLCRPLFATMILFVAENDDLKCIDNEYDLIELFLKKWLERDNTDKKRKTRINRSNYDEIRNIALRIYLKKNEYPLYNKNVIPFHDLLVISKSDERYIQGFYHREFLVYFIVNALIGAALNHPERIIWWFSQTFYDDITNMIKPVLDKMNVKSTETIYNNLFEVYKKTYIQKNEITQEFKELNLIPEQNLLKLRDELSYFIFKLRKDIIDHNEFASYVYKNIDINDKNDTILFLGLAYGMARIDPNNQYTLNFAQRLLDPESHEAIRNRGWGMCFFGDVEEDGYTYEDQDKKPWPKIRENRLTRLADNTEKYVTRVLDIPLLYCFYASRSFLDCTSYRDYTIIKETNISDHFATEQIEFLQKQRDHLLAQYRKQLLLNEIKYNVSLVASIQKECIKMNNETGSAMIEVDKKLAEKILQYTRYREDVENNLEEFWNNKGVELIHDHKALLETPNHNNINAEQFEEKLSKCQLIIISANSVEGAVITNCLLKESCQTSALDAFPYEGNLFQFATIENIAVCHIWPTDTSSFTQYGSFSALKATLEKAVPKYVIAVGVAFGIDPNSQSLGDVLVSKELVFYDHFNKVTDGKTNLNPHEVYRTDPNICALLHRLDQTNPPKDVGMFRWYFGSMLTGGTVLSDAVEKDRLLESASEIGQKKIIGGEMEASGIYYACQKHRERKIPFLIIKGICDWGVSKNGWKKIIDKNQLENEVDGDKIKDCIQAYACTNAYYTMRFVLRQLNFDI